MAKQIDPVCGKEIEAEISAGESYHQTNTFYFCTLQCKAGFDQNPEKYTNSLKQGNNASFKSKGSGI